MWTPCAEWDRADGVDCDRALSTSLLHGSGSALRKGSILLERRGSRTGASFSKSAMPFALSEIFSWGRKQHRLASASKTIELSMRRSGNAKKPHFLTAQSRRNLSTVNQKQCFARLRQRCKGRE